MESKWSYGLDAGGSRTHIGRKEGRTGKLGLPRHLNTIQHPPFSIIPISSIIPAYPDSLHEGGEAVPLPLTSSLPCLVIITNWDPVYLSPGRSSCVHIILLHLIPVLNPQRSVGSLVPLFLIVPFRAFRHALNLNLFFISLAFTNRKSTFLCVGIGRGGST